MKTTTLETVDENKEQNLVEEKTSPKKNEAEDSEDDDDFPEMIFEGSNRPDHRGIPNKIPSTNEKCILYHGHFRRPADSKIPETKRTIFICLENSPYSLECLEWCAETILCSSDNIVLLHCQEWSPVRMELLPIIKLEFPETNERMYKSCFAKASRFMQVASVKCATFGCRPHEFRLGIINKKQHSVKNFILEQIKEEKPGLVILGARGLNSVNRVFLGSTSDYLVHHCSSPILVYKPMSEKMKSKAILDGRKSTQKVLYEEKF